MQSPAMAAKVTERLWEVDDLRGVVLETWEANSPLGRQRHLNSP